MQRLAFAVGLLAFGFTAASPARADFAVVEFNSGYCRVWTDTVFGPEDGHYLWFLSPSLGWRYRFLTFEGGRRGNASGCCHTSLLSLVVAIDCLTAARAGRYRLILSRLSLL